VRGEKDFDRAEFLASIDALLEETLAYRIPAAEAVERLRGMGFAIQ